MSTLALPAMAERFFERFDLGFSFVYRHCLEMSNDQAGYLRGDLGSCLPLGGHSYLAFSAALSVARIQCKQQ